MNLQHIGLVGYGEVGKIFSAGLKGKARITAVSAWDLKFAEPAIQAAELAHAKNAGVAAQPSTRALCESSDLVISAVTASCTLAVAGEAAQFILFSSVARMQDATNVDCMRVTS